METKFECPHCRTEHVLTEEELKEIDRGGKVVISCDNADCEKLYTIEECDGVYFIPHRRENESKA